MRQPAAQTPAPPPTGHRWLCAVILACSLSLLVPLMVPLFTGRVFVYNDLSWFHLPLRYLYQQALRSGDTVLWTPSILAGFYLHGEGQAGLFHPVHQLLYRLLPLGAAFNLELIVNYPTAFAGTFWFLRRLRFTAAASLFGAMLFAFSGFNLLHYEHVNMVAVVAHMPWLLACADALIADARRHAQTLAFTGMVLLLGSEFLLGFPQGAWWNLIALGAFAAFRAGGMRRWRQLGACGAAVVLGVLLGGVQWLPSAETAAHSTRVGVSRDFALSLSLHPSNLIQLWSPYVFASGAHSVGEWMWFHEFGIYSGAILPVSVAWVWSRRGALVERRRLITAVTIFAAVMMVLALGRYGGVAALLARLPVIESLRAPVRYVVLVQFALAILAAIAFDDLLAITDGRRPGLTRTPLALLIPAALGVATAVALNARLLPSGAYTFATASAALPGVGIVIAVTLLVYLAGRRMRWALAALVIVTSIDLAAWGIRFIYRVPAQRASELVQAIPPAPDDPDQAYAAAPRRGPYEANLLVLRGYRLTTGYVGLYPATRYPLDSEAARRLSGTRWVFASDGQRRPAEGAVERVRLVEEEGRPSVGTARLVVDRPGHLIAEVDAPGRRIVALTERFHEGWSATSDRVRLHTVRVEGDFLGCVVEGGIRRVELTFLPQSFVYGAVTSAVGVALLAGVVIARLRAVA